MYKRQTPRLRLLKKSANAPPPQSVPEYAVKPLVLAVVVVVVVMVGVTVRLVPPTPKAFLVLTPRGAARGPPAAMAGTVGVMVGMAAVAGAVASTVGV